jgi:predicted transcriptional regulator
MTIRALTAEKARNDGLYGHLYNGRDVLILPASSGFANPRWQVRGRGTAVVPLAFMAMNLRLSDAEIEALRRKAEEEGRSMQNVARSAIADYVSDRPGRLRAAIERVRVQDAELLKRLRD